MRAGQVVRAANAQARGALSQANTRLVNDRAIYAATCAAFSATLCGH